MSPQEQITLKRQLSAQTHKEQQELNSMLAEMKKMQMASLMGSQGKSTVILTDQTDLGDKLKEMNDKVVSAIEAIETPVIPSSVSVSNMTDNTKELKELLTAIKSLRLVAEAPVVNVPEPKVTVQNHRIDFSPLQSTIREAMSQREPITVVNEADKRIDLSRYRAVDIKNSGDDLQYVGFMNPEGNWYIIENKIKENSMRYVFGTSGYSKHFKACAQYKYQLLDKAINAAS